MIAGLTFRHVDASWASDLHQLKIVRSRSNGLQWSRVELSGASDFHHDQSFIGRRWNFVEELHDRGAIEPRSRRSWRGISADLSPIDRQAIDEALAPRSTPDRDAIVARSWRKSRRKRGKSEAKLKLNTSRFVAELKPRPRPKGSPPRRQQTTSTIVSITHDFGPNSLFKSMYFPLLFFNFWSTREEIKRISRKVLSSRDPLLPRV